MPIVEIRCPSCEKKGTIEIPAERMKHVLRGLLAVNVANAIICSHSFIAYIDKNYNPRDYFTADFHIEIPELSPIEKIQGANIPVKEVVDIDLIRLNLTAILLSYTLKFIFSKQKFVIISNQEFLYDHIINFYDYITKDSFETDISIISEESYKENKKQYKDAVVLNGIGINKNVKNTINPKKLNVEKSIIIKFLTEKDLGLSYIMLKNEIQKAFVLAKSIANYITKEREEHNKVSILKIQSELENEFKVKIDMLYLKFLIEIVINYFKVSVPSLIDGFFNII